MVKLSKHTADKIGRTLYHTSYIEAPLISPDRVAQDVSDPVLSRSYKVIPQYGNRVLRVVHRPDCDVYSADVARLRECTRLPTELKPRRMGGIAEIRAALIALLLSINVLQLAGCVSEPTVTAEQAQIPPIPAGLARVWVVRQFEPGLGVQWTPMTYIDGAPFASSYAGTAFYRDLPPGTYNFTVESCTTDFNQNQALRLTPGMRADLEVQVLNSIPAWGCYDPNTFYIRLIPPQWAQRYFSQVRYVGAR